MQSIKYIFKIGHGPSSSHTMGPAKACTVMLERYPLATSYKVILFGSLALTGKGHLTDKIIKETFKDKPCEIVFNYTEQKLYHPNTLDIYAYHENKIVGYHRFYSIGGGSLLIEGEEKAREEDIYPVRNFEELKVYLYEHHLDLISFILKVEGEEILAYLDECFEVMKETIQRGLRTTGLLPGELKVARKAQTIFNKTGSNLLQKKIFAYAYAMSEENASGALIVTAPTCGSCGVLPSVLLAVMEEEGYKKEEILKSMLVAGLIGNFIKNNASISGAEAGCQAEIGAACSMSSAAYAYLKGLSLNEIEQAAEISLEHHLGLTCDPIKGYVQIPCIERNAICALRSIDSVNLINYIDVNDSKITFDMVCKTMLETGRDLKNDYRETAKGGLAKEYKK